MRITRQLLIIIAAATGTYSFAIGAELPQGIMDLDKQVAFTSPFLITVFQGYQADHTYFILPNNAKLDQQANGAPKLSLLYGQAGTGKKAILTLEGTISFAADYQNAVDEIKREDPAAKFVIPEPSSFTFRLETPGSDRAGATIDSAKINSSGHFEIMAKVDDITSRVMLIPYSYKYNSISVVYSPTYRGVIRTADGTPRLGERSWDVGAIGGGACALSPERYVSWVTKKAGCSFPVYSPPMMRSIQRSLKRLGFYSGALDADYGPLTVLAIKAYQLSKGETQDGLPTLELELELKNASRPTPISGTAGSVETSWN